MHIMDMSSALWKYLLTSLINQEEVDVPLILMLPQFQTFSEVFTGNLERTFLDIKHSKMILLCIIHCQSNQLKFTLGMWIILEKTWEQCTLKMLRTYVINCLRRERSQVVSLQKVFKAVEVNSINLFCAQIGLISLPAYFFFVYVINFVSSTKF